MVGSLKSTANQLEDPGLNPWLGQGLNFGRSSLATPSVKLLVQSHDILSWDLKEPRHTLINKSRLKPVLWTVSFSPIKDSHKSSGKLNKTDVDKEGFG